MVAATRESLMGMRQAGDSEGRLRLELLDCHQAVATARAGQERAEAQAGSWKAEARVLRERLAAAGKVRVLRERLVAAGKVRVRVCV